MRKIIFLNVIMALSINFATASDKCFDSVNKQVKTIMSSDKRKLTNFSLKRLTNLQALEFMTRSSYFIPSGKQTPYVVAERNREIAVNLTQNDKVFFYAYEYSHLGKYFFSVEDHYINIMSVDSNNCSVKVDVAFLRDDE